MDKYSYLCQLQLLQSTFHCHFLLNILHEPHFFQVELWLTGREWSSIIEIIWHVKVAIACDESPLLDTMYLSGLESKIMFMELGQTATPWDICNADPNGWFFVYFEYHFDNNSIVH